MGMDTLCEAVGGNHYHVGPAFDHRRNGQEGIPEQIFASSGGFEFLLSHVRRAMRRTAVLKEDVKRVVGCASWGWFICWVSYGGTPSSRT